MGSNPTLAAPVWRFHGLRDAKVSDPRDRLPGMNAPVRPTLDERLSAAELRRWYWLRSELVVLARSLGITAAGGKIELTDRLCAVLDGHPREAATPRRLTGAQLLGPLDDQTVIPPGQRCSEHLRRFFIARVGPSFRFDAATRDFIRASTGLTLGDAVRHWRATRTVDGPPDIAPQFELNRFTRDWCRDHPGGSRQGLAAAWLAHRSLPAELRSTPDPGG